MAVRVYLGSVSAAHSEVTYDQADSFSVTAGGCLLIQRQHSGAQKDLAVFAPNAWKSCRSRDWVRRNPPGESQPGQSDQDSITCQTALTD